MSNKPSIVLVPGAWHGPSHFAPLVSGLEASGYKTVPVEHASVGAPTPLEDFQPDVERIKAAIEGELASQQDVVVLMHSYGSMPTLEAVKGLEKKAGGAPGVSHLIFCASFVPPPDTSLMDMLGGNDLPWFKINNERNLVEPDNTHHVFYGDLSKEESDKHTAALKPHSYKVFSSKSRNTSWKEIPCTYMFCEDDMAIPIQAQQGMVQGSGVNFNTVSYKASHSPFLSMPDEMVATIKTVAV